MQTDIILTIIIVSFIQSIFGVGILLFGTPLLLILGNTFQESLSILLPISILVNILQLYNKVGFVDKIFYKRLILFCIPLIIIFLYVVSVNTLNIKPLIGIFLILIAISKSLSFTSKFNMKKYENIYLLITGLIHGLSNLGGALLSAIIFSKNLTKEEKRATIAISYLTFAVFQLITLTYIYQDDLFIFKHIIIYCFIGLIIFLLVDKLIFVKINEENYNLYFSILIFIIGLLLIISS